MYVRFCSLVHRVLEVHAGFRIERSFPFQLGIIYFFKCMVAEL